MIKMSLGFKTTKCLERWLLNRGVALDAQSLQNVVDIGPHTSSQVLLYLIFGFSSAFQRFVKRLSLALSYS